jgi:hypothetical protein
MGAATAVGAVPLRIARKHCAETDIGECELRLKSSEVCRAIGHLSEIQNTHWL